jgi:CHAT domain-containing protein
MKTFGPLEATGTGYRILHFSTYGLLDSEHPGLSGLVLSLVDRQGSQVDGFLRLEDIFNLNLHADLAVLSACQTGLGKNLRAEGMVGLTRGFMYSGVPRVIVSLWNVDDRSTAELMLNELFPVPVTTYSPAANDSRRSF